MNFRSIMIMLPALLVLGNCDKQQSLPEPRFVTAKEGLRLREQPALDGKVLGLVPFGAEVTLIREQGGEMEISGSRGKWSRIAWSGKEGWVFGGFLAKGDKTNSQVNGKYTLVDDPYHKQYIEFTSPFECTIMRNWCEGFGTEKCSYIIEGSNVSITGTNIKGLILKIVSDKDLIIEQGAIAFTCGNLQDGTRLAK